MITKEQIDLNIGSFIKEVNENLPELNYDGNRLDGLEGLMGTEAAETILGGFIDKSKLGTGLAIAAIGALANFAIIPAITGILNMFDSAHGGVQDTVVTIPVVVSDDIPKGIRDDYCACLEILYGMIIKSSVDGRTRSGSGDVSRIMRSLPFLTNQDKVKVAGSVALISDATGRVIKEKEGNVKVAGDTAVSVFLESMQTFYNEKASEIPAMEGEEVFVKTGRSGLPTFISVEAVVKSGSKLEKKRLQIGIRCIAKTVSKEEVIAFFVKHKNAVAEVKTATSIWQKVKNVVTLSFLRNKNAAVETSPGTVKTLESMLNAVKSIDKPFVSLLLSDEIRQLLADNGLNITNPSYVKTLYAKYPILSLSFFDANSDTFLVSLLQDSVFVRRSVSELNSERDKYEKVIGDMVRANRLIQ